MTAISRLPALQTLLLAAATCAVAALTSFHAPQARAELFDKDRVKCESKDTRRETCDTKWPGQTELLRQLSDTRCVQGRTWGASPGKVWVSGGCRAEFGPQFNGKSLKCESNDGKHRTCGKDLYGNADLIRQLSSTPCTQGVSWGQNNGSIWVDKGCRGEFRIGESSGRFSLTCGSENGRRATCPWDSRRGMPTVLESLSRSPCVEGRSWGYDRRAGSLWVDEGCRARFGVR